MAEIRAFRGVRYDASRVSRLSDVVCAPYDVITPEAQADCYRRDEHNAVRLELGRDESGDDAASNRYTRAAQQLRRWLREGVLIRDDQPSLYVYEESFESDGRAARRRSVFATVRLEEWDRGIVLPHERTMPKPRADRLSLLRACRASLSPVFSLYEDPAGQVAETLDAATRREPIAELRLRPGAVAAAATEHRLWRLADERQIGLIQRELAGRPLYIADGHHRYETALDYWRERRSSGAGGDHPSAWTLMMLADLADPGLLVLPTHRLVRTPDLDRAALRRGLEELFSVEELPWSVGATGLTARLAALAGGPGSPHVFGLVGLASGVVHVLAARSGSAVERRLPRDHSAAWRELDVAVLHGLVLEGLLGMGVDAPGDLLTYTRDAEQAWSGVAAGDHDLAFLVNPTRVAQIRDVALAGDRMPEKSTYFWPKPPTGLVFYDHEQP